MEIEKRFCCKNISSVGLKLESMGFTKIREENQVDLPISQVYPTIIHAWPRIRFYPSTGRTIITVKGKRFDEQLGPIRAESEIETPEFIKAKELFKALGFYEMGQVEKTRTIYEKGFIEVAIDRVKDLGDFVEIEVKQENSNLALKEIDELSKELNLTEESIGGYFDCINKVLCEDFNNTYGNLLKQGVALVPKSQFQILNGNVLKVFSKSAAYYGGFPDKILVVEDETIILKPKVL